MTSNPDQITVTLPDGATRTYDAGVTAGDIASDIAISLGKSAIAARLDGQLVDLDLPIMADTELQIITKRDPAALELIRHDCAHVLAEAVQDLYPETQVTIGPVIDDGFYYDFDREDAFTPEDLEKIESRMHEIIKRDENFKREVWSRDQAINHFDTAGEEYKVELIRDLPDDEEITIYRQGDWLDLCRGPHMPSTGWVGDAFKLTHVAGAYWRGDSDNAMLQRIYGTAWRDQEELDAHLTKLREAEKRDHRKLGTQMDLFHFQKEAPGQPFWHHHGWTIFTTLLDYMRGKLDQQDYTEVNTPQLLNAKFWQASGHWDKYRDNMFEIDMETSDSDIPVALKPMSCPGGAQVYLSDLRSYRDLPMRMAEFGKVFRKEASGARHGLMRVQAFTQDDAHIFCTDDQLEDEVVKMCELIEQVYSDTGFDTDQITVKFSDRPDEFIGTVENWDRAEAALKKAGSRMGYELVENPGDGAFYAPKLDFILTDAIGREWQCGTIQVDMNMPHRLELEYVGEDGDRHTPHMVHRAIFGSVERFIGVLIEHHAGNLPFWLAPRQVVVATITNEFDEYAQKVHDRLSAAGVRSELDLRSDKIGYKIREHSATKTPVILVIGGREAEQNTVAMRVLGGEDQIIKPLDAVVDELSDKARIPS